MRVAKALPRNFLVFFLLVVSCACVVGQDSSVCITSTGSKYHRCSCQYLRSSSIEITLNKALDNGYTACSVCRPSSTASTGHKQPLLADTTVHNDNRLSKPVQRATASTQCTATTKAGSRCKRMTSESNRRCWQHQ